MTMAAVAGVDCSPFVLADSVDRFGVVGDLFPGMLDGEVVHSNVSQLIGGCLEWLGHKFPKELSLVVVCTDDMATQFMLVMLIIDHLTAVHQCLDVCDKILGVLSQPGHNIFEFSEMHMGVDIMCHSQLDLVKEGRSFCLGHFLFLFAASWHPLCMHFWGFGSQGCKDVPEVVLTIWQNAVEEEPVLQGKAKYGERVIGILGIPVVDGRLMDAVLSVSALAKASVVAWADWVISCCGVSFEAMSQVLDCLIMVRMGKTGGIQKWLYLRNHWPDLLQNLTQYS